MKFVPTEDSAFAEEESIESKKADVSLYAEHLSRVRASGEYLEDESSVCLPEDENMRANVREVVGAFDTSKLKYVIVVGIGGSNLGTAAVNEALFGEMDPYSARMPKILFADTVNAKKIRDIADLACCVESADQLVVNVISKSGTTTETIANFSWLLERLSERFSDISTQVVVTTDEGSRLYEYAKEKGYKHLTLPSKVGGRFSVFSAVGIFPLLLVGVDVDGLLSGAREALRVGTGNEQKENHALVSAAIRYAHYRSGKNIHNMFVFKSELEGVGKWYRQLMGESIGKKHNVRDEVVREGIMPIVSVGSTDLHSMAQLYLGGPRDIFTTFVSVESDQSDFTLPGSEGSSLVSGVSGRHENEILENIFLGVKVAYKKEALPFTEIVLSDVSAFSVGELMQFQMLEIMYLARLLEIHAFDQPSVELYKEETRKLLSEK